MPKESRLEFIVGGTVILAIVCLAAFILSVGDFALFEKGHDMRVVFGFASGVKQSAPVRMAGVEAGVVKDVRLFFDKRDHKTKAEVFILVNDGIKIPVDSTVMINQLGLLGEKYVEIIPGKDTRNFLKAGGTVLGKDPVIQEQISQKVLDVAEKVEDGIEGINAIISNQESQQSLKVTLQKLGSISTNLDQILAHVKTGEGTIGKLFYDNHLYDNLEEMTADLKDNPWKLLYKPKNK